VVSSSSDNWSSAGGAKDTHTSTTFAWYDGAVTFQIRHDSDTADLYNAIYTTDYSYDASGQLASVRINDGRPRTVSFTNDMSGQVLRRDEADALSGGDPHEVWYRFGGRQLGFTGNNGTLDTDYMASIDNRVKTQGTGAFRFGESQADAHADFAQSFDPINSYGAGGGGGSYTARAGETLASIAAQLWGDASLWYKLAEANGLSGASGLSDGQTLTIPAGVIKNTHNAGTFKPYDPLEALGDTSPTSPAIPKPPRRGNKCGMFGAVLLVVVAVAVTIATKGAFAKFAGGVLKGVFGAAAAAKMGATATVIGGAMAGATASAVSQGVGLATGIQDRFSWKGVAMAGIGGGVGGALSGIDAFGTASGIARFGSDVVRGALGSAIGQGIGVATGLQRKFDWAGVAAAGVISGVSGAALRGLGAEALVGKGANTSLANHLRHAGANAAGAIAGAATRSVATGTSFGDNVMAVLPDVIGSTIGNMVAHGVAGSGKMSAIEKEFIAEAERSANAPAWVASQINGASDSIGPMSAALDENISPGGLLRPASLTTKFGNDWLEDQLRPFTPEGIIESLAEGVADELKKAGRSAAEIAATTAAIATAVPSISAAIAYPGTTPNARVLLAQFLTGFGESVSYFGPKSPYTRELFSGFAGEYYRDLTKAGIESLAKLYDGQIPDHAVNSRFFYRDFSPKTGSYGFMDGMIQVSDVVGSFTYGVRVERVGNNIQFTGRNAMSLESHAGNNILGHNLVVNPRSGPLSTKVHVFRWTVPIPHKYR